MTFPSPWIDSLFGRLSLRYGAPFMAQWNDAKIEAVKDDWREVLDGFENHPDAIRYALDNLPDKPLNAQAFRAIARRAPKNEPVLLPAPKTPPENVKAVLDQARASIPQTSNSAAQQVIDGILDRCAKRGAMSRRQREFCGTCVSMLPEGDERRVALRKWGVQ